MLDGWKAVHCWIREDCTDYFLIRLMPFGSYSDIFNESAGRMIHQCHKFDVDTPPSQRGQYLSQHFICFSPRVIWLRRLHGHPWLPLSAAW